MPRLRSYKDKESSAHHARIMRMMNGVTQSQAAESANAYLAPLGESLSREIIRKYEDPATESKIEGEPLRAVALAKVYGVEPLELVPALPLSAETLEKIGQLLELVHGASEPEREPEPPASRVTRRKKVAPPAKRAATERRSQPGHARSQSGRPSS